MILGWGAKKRKTTAVGYRDWRRQGTQAGRNRRQQGSLTHDNNRNPREKQANDGGKIKCHSATKKSSSGNHGQGTSSDPVGTCRGMSHLTRSKDRHRHSNTKPKVIHRRTSQIHQYKIKKSEDEQHKQNSKYDFFHCNKARLQRSKVVNALPPSFDYCNVK
jgi:hypothetical protein